MPFADADGFWKPPNVFDVLSVAGFVVGIASIWVSWWLAKRDIEKRLTEAADRASATARDEVRRVAKAVLHSGLADTIRSLELTREACGGKQWRRAAEVCQLAREQLARVLAQPAADEAIQPELRDLYRVLQDCVNDLRVQPKTGTGTMPADVSQGLDESIVALHRVEGRMTGIQLEAGRG